METRWLHVIVACLLVPYIYCNVNFCHPMSCTGEGQEEEGEESKHETEVSSTWDSYKMETYL